jgi:hypothetical protein
MIAIRVLTTQFIYVFRANLPMNIGFISFRFVVLPSSTYLFTVGVEVVYFHLITLRHTVGRVPLDEGSARRRDL